MNGNAITATEFNERSVDIIMVSGGSSGYATLQPICERTWIAGNRGWAELLVESDLCSAQNH
ncbi:hypothetical protein T06_3483 [Trichinella sp. T6]|nr:hypothetical protein T06_3483 [Trichinella sp. T6]